MERTEFLELIKEHKELIRNQQKRMSEITKKMIEKFFKEFFERNKEIHKVGWVQYTPYFNDGDACNFSVHSDNIYINGINVYDDEYLELSDFSEQIEEIEKFLNEMPESAMEEIYEEGIVTYKILQDELIFTVEDYDHH